MGTTPSPRLAGFLRPLVQTAGFLRKETSEILRQPRLVLVLVIGPFIVLFLFAAGYDDEQAVLDTVFVGPKDSLYEESLDQYTEELAFYVDNAGYTSDLVEAERRLRDGDVDLVVAFPVDPADTVLAGEQASIIVLHDKLDPIQQTAVEIAAEVAVQELNSTVLAEVVRAAQSSLVPYATGVDETTELVRALDVAVAVSDEPEIQRITADIQANANGMSVAVDATSAISERLEGSLDPEQQAELDDLQTSLRLLADASAGIGDEAGDVEEADVDRLRAALDEVAAHGETVQTLDPEVIVRPFTSDAENLVRERVDVNDFFAPAAIALLLQHMVLTFAALSLVKDRANGLFEVYRVGPIGAGQILIGKFLSYLVVGAAAGAALVTAVTLALDVPLRGNIWWVVIGLAGVLTASILAGTVLSLISRTDTQAVQYAMLTLLAGLFFGGFLLDVDAFRYPFKALSWALPVTYGVRILRDVMLRGDGAAAVDLIGLGAMSIVLALLAYVMLARHLKVR